MRLGLALLLLGGSAQANFLSDCMGRILYVQQAKEWAAAGTQSIHLRPGFLWDTVRVSGPGFSYTGRQVKPPYDFYSGPRRTGYHVHAALHTKEGLEFYVLSEVDYLAGRDYRKRQGDRIRARIWRTAAQYPEWTRPYGIHADADLLVMPRLGTLNRLLDQIDPHSDHAVGPRFESDTSEERQESAFEWALVGGRILRHVKGEDGVYDLFSDGFRGALMVRPELFARFRNLAMRVKALRADPFLGGDFRRELKDAYRAFQPFWEEWTEEMSWSFFNPRWTRAVEEGTRDRNVLWRLMGGHGMSQEDAGRFGAGGEKAPSLWHLAQAIDIVARLSEKVDTLPKEKRSAMRFLLEDISIRYPAGVVDISLEEERLARKMGTVEGADADLMPASTRRASK